MAEFLETKAIDVDDNDTNDNNNTATVYVFSPLFFSKKTCQRCIFYLESLVRENHDVVPCIAHNFFKFDMFFLLFR